MLPQLQTNSLTKALKWLILFISLTLILLLIGMVSFNYLASEVESDRINELNAVANDTLSSDTLQQAISVTNLLTTPEKYHDGYVWVKGYLHLEFEGDAIYRSKSDYLNHLSGNAYRVSFSDSLTKKKRIENYSDRQVIIRGLYRTYYGGFRTGIITNISDVRSSKVSVR